MQETKLIKIDCPICGKDSPYKVKYEANFDIASLDFAAKKTTKPTAVKKATKAAAAKKTSKAKK